MDIRQKFKDEVEKILADSLVGRTFEIPKENRAFNPGTFKIVGIGMHFNLLLERLTGKKSKMEGSMLKLDFLINDIGNGSITNFSLTQEELRGLLSATYEPVFEELIKEAKLIEDKCKY